MKTLQWSFCIIFVIVLSYSNSECHYIELPRNIIEVELLKWENVSMTIQNDHQNTGNNSLHIETIWDERALKVYPKYIEIQTTNASNWTFNFYLQGRITGDAVVDFNSSSTLRHTRLLVRVVSSKYVEDLINYIRILSYLILSTSMYPQLYTVKNIHSIVGLSVDYVYLNILARGLDLFYGIEMSCSSLLEEYHRRYPKGHTPITVVDNAFTFHGFIIASILCLQANRYYSEHKRLSTIAKIILVLYLIVPGGAFVLEKLSILHMLDVLCVVKYVQSVVLITRYIPQFRRNYLRKCTYGWNIWGPVIELFGYILVLAEIMLKYFNTGIINSSLENNYIELTVTSISIIYIIIFIIQHCVLYNEPEYSYFDKENAEIMDLEYEEERTLFVLAY